MSRVDDDRAEAQRTQERLLKQIRQQSNRAEDKAQESAFARRMQGRTQVAETTATQQDEALDFNKLLREAAGQTEEGAQTESPQSFGYAQKRGLRRALASDQQSQAFGKDLKKDDAGTDAREVAQKASDESGEGAMAAGKARDFGAGASAAAGRSTDARSSEDSATERGAESKQSAQAAKGARDAHELKTDAEGGGKGGGQQQMGQQESGVPAGFRFNPALMAPVPVAKPKEGAGSERLRKVANEIAQKIVESVRVGTNAAGATEFQIDLRGDVLSGLSIKVSAKQGKISATFLGSDRKVLKLLREQSEALASALKGRGLTLDDLKIEERA